MMACDGRRAPAPGAAPERVRRRQYTIHNKFGPLFYSVAFFPDKPRDNHELYRDNRVTINRTESGDCSIYKCIKCIKGVWLTAPVISSVIISLLSSLVSL